MKCTGSAIESTREPSRGRPGCQEELEEVPGFSTRPDGSFTNSTPETARHLLETHFPGRGSVKSVPQRPPREPGPGDWTIRKFKPYKSAGNDGIFPALLKEGEEFLVEPFRGILKSSFFDENGNP